MPPCNTFIEHLVITMDIRKIKKLIELLEESDITELEIKEGDEAVRISRSSRGDAATHRAEQE